METKQNSAIQNLIEEVNETILLTDDYINKAIPLIRKLSEEFYNEPDKDA